jgi:O-antigen ligase
MISGLMVIIIITSTIVISLFQLLYLRFIVYGYLTTEGRFNQYQNALFIIKNHFLNGLGLNNYGFAMIINDISGIAAAEPQYPVHNLYLLYFAETGVIGISLFILFIVSIYYKVYNILKSTIFNIYLLSLIVGGIGGLSSIFLQSFLGWGFRSITMFSVFFVLGLIIASINIAKAVNSK